MNAVPFDTSKIAQRSEAAGFPASQTVGVFEGLAEAVVGAVLATKSDIAGTTTEIAATTVELKADTAGTKAGLKADVAAIHATVMALEAKCWRPSNSFAAT